MAITAETRTEIIQMVVGTLNAAPGFTILTELVEAYDAGTLVSPELVQIMVDNPAFEQDYPLFLTNEEFAERYFETLLSPAVPELEDETDTLMDEIVELAAGLLNGGMTRAELIFTAVEFLSGASEDDPILGAAVAQFNNKVEVAEHFSVDAEQDAASVPLLQQVIDGVTNDEATVDTAIAVIDGDVAAGETVLLTTDQDNIEGTPANTTIKGSFGSATATENTANAGDTIDGGTGTDTVSLTATGTNASSAAFEVMNVDAIEIKDVVGATFNAIGVEDDPTIRFNSTLDGQVSSVTNASETSQIGMTGKGDLTVTYAGSADSADLWLGGVGTSASNRSTIDASNGGDTESVTIATTGTNFVTAAFGGETADVTITGDGTNFWNFGTTTAAATSVAVDASESTGTNTFDFEAQLTAGDSILGGTGTDELRADFTTASLFSPELAGIESLRVDFMAAATLDLQNSTDVASIRIDDGDDAIEIKNANSTLTSMTTIGATNVKAYEVRYDEDSPGTLTNFFAANAFFNGVYENVTSLSIVNVYNGVYDTLLFAFGVDIEGGLDMSSIRITGSTDTTTDTGTIELVDGGNVGAFTVSIGDDAIYSGGLYLSDTGDVGPVTITAGDGGDVAIEVETDDGSIGDITINSESQLYSAAFYASGGSIGNVNITLTGDDASGSTVFITSSGGSIGNVTIDLQDGASELDLSVSANNDYNGDDETDDTDGNIGDVSITLGDDTSISGDFDAEGDIGNITINYVGEDNSGSLYFQAAAVSGIGNDDGDDYARGGNIGDVTIAVTGNGANLSADFIASGGDIGAVHVTLDGGDTVEADFYASNGFADSGGDGGNIGAMTFDLLDGASADFDITFAGTLESLDVNAGDGLDIEIYISGNDGKDEDTEMGDATFTLGEDVDLTYYISGGVYEINDTTIVAGDGLSADVTFNVISGDIGNISVTAGDDSSLYLHLSGNSGDVGNIDLDFGDGADIDIHLHSDNDESDISLITIAGGGAGDEANIDIYDFDSVAGIDASDWEGFLSANLSGVSTGTNIKVGADGSYIAGTQEGDNITLGGGTDEVYLEFETTDSIFDFEQGDDTIDVTYFADNASVDVDADADEQSLTDRGSYVFADGTDGTDDEEITDFTDLEDVAEFLAAAFSDEATDDDFVATINDGAGTSYIYYVNMTGDATLDDGDITLIGVVSADDDLAAEDITAA